MFRSNGDLHLVDEEKNKLLLGHFDRKTGRLEFETEAFSNKYSRQVTMAIGTVDDGVKSSGLLIQSVGVKGDVRDAPASAPPRPKRSPLYGDQTPALVEWYFKYYPHEAYRRYGVFLDANGEPVRRNVRRKTTEVIDDRDGSKGLQAANDGKGQQTGPKTFENGPIARVGYIDTLENQIVARRATCMTYAPQEVIGGFDTGEEEPEETAVEAGEGEA